MLCMNDAKDNKDWVSFLGVRRQWVGIALQIFSILVLVYTIFATRDHLSGGWLGFKTLRAIVLDVTTFIPTAGAVPLILFTGVDILMILYGLVKEGIEKRRKIREAQGEAQGRLLANREWLDWNARRQAAEAAGEEFTEPNPAEKHADYRS